MLTFWRATVVRMHVCICFLLGKSEGFGSRWSRAIGLGSSKFRQWMLSIPKYSQIIPYSHHVQNDFRLSFLIYFPGKKEKARGKPPNRGAPCPRGVVSERIRNHCRCCRHDLLGDPWGIMGWKSDVEHVKNTLKSNVLMILI